MNLGERLPLEIIVPLEIVPAGARLRDSLGLLETASSHQAGLRLTFSEEVVSLSKLNQLKSQLRQTFDLAELQALFDLLFYLGPCSRVISLETIFLSISGQRWTVLESEDLLLDPSKARRDAASVFLFILAPEVSPQGVTPCQEVKLQSILQLLNTVLAKEDDNEQATEQLRKQWKAITNQSFNTQSDRSNWSSSVPFSEEEYSGRHSSKEERLLSGGSHETPEERRVTRLSLLLKHMSPIRESNTDTLISDVPRVESRDEQLVEIKTTSNRKRKMLLIGLLLIALMIGVSTTIFEYMSNRYPCSNKDYYEKNVNICSPCGVNCVKCIAPNQCALCGKGSLVVTGEVNSQSYGYCQ